LSKYSAHPRHQQEQLAWGMSAKEEVMSHFKVKAGWPASPKMQQVPMVVNSPFQKITMQDSNNKFEKENTSMRSSYTKQVNYPNTEKFQLTIRSHGSSPRACMNPTASFQTKSLTWKRS